MARILLVALWAGVVIYALADWFRADSQAAPARISKSLWLLLIMLTIPSFALGAVAWIILRAVARAEARQRGEEPEPTLFDEVSKRVSGSDASVLSEPLAPDDDPDFLFRIERDIARRRAEERREKERHERMFNGDEKTSQDPDKSAENGDFSQDEE